MTADRVQPPIALAVVTRPHGVRGAVRMKVFNPDTTVLAPGLRATLALREAPARTVQVLTVTPAKETWMVTFEGVTSLEAAEALRGAELQVPRTALPELEEGEFYHVDLPGCDVLDQAGQRMGVVKQVASYPSVDALVVDTADGELEIPIVDGIVTRIDVPARQIVVDAEMLREA